MTEKLVIVYPKAIGDFMFILPALHTLRKAMPDTHITLVVKNKQAPLAKPQEGILADKVLSLGGGNSWMDIRRTLKHDGIDTLVDMAGNDQSGLIVGFRSGSRLRPAWSDCKGVAGLYSLFAHSMPKLMPGLHRVDELLSYARCLANADPVYSFRMQLPDQAIEESLNVIRKYELRSGKVIILNIGASRDNKRWPAESFLKLTEDLVANGLRVVITGARTFKSDKDYDLQVSDRLFSDSLVDGDKCINLITESDISPALQLQRDTHLLRYSKVPAVVVGNDTGPMQIAGSVGDDAKVKTVSLFGPTNWGRYAPYDPSRSYPGKPAGEWNTVMTADRDCMPTGTQEACRKYRKGCTLKECMADIKPQTVMDAIQNAIAG